MIRERKTPAGDGGSSGQAILVNNAKNTVNPSACKTESLAARFTELQRLKVFERPFLATVDGRWVKRLTGRELLSYTAFRGRAAESGIFLPDVTKAEWEQLVPLRLAQCVS
jgi:hypothetical protein